MCLVKGTVQVRYGANGKYITKTVTGSISCTNGAFGGDPAYGVVKSCSIAPAAVPTWTLCAQEGGQCSFAGKREVRYGAGTRVVSKTLTGPVACTNATFGDPAYGVVKSCSFSSVVQ